MNKQDGSQYKFVKIAMDFCADPVWGTNYAATQEEVDSPHYRKGLTLGEPIGFANLSLEEFTRLPESLIKVFKCYQFIWESLSHALMYDEDDNSIEAKLLKESVECNNNLSYKLAVEFKKYYPEINVYYNVFDAHTGTYKNKEVLNKQ